MAILKVTGKALMAGVTSLVATLNGAQWVEFTDTEKFVAAATAAASMWLVIDAFLDQTMAVLQKESEPRLAKDKAEAENKA